MLKSLSDIPYGKSTIFINNLPIPIYRRKPDSKFSGCGKGLNWKDGQPEPVYIELDDSHLFRGISDVKSLKLYLDKLGIEGLDASLSLIIVVNKTNI